MQFEKDENGIPRRQDQRVFVREGSIQFKLKSFKVITIETPLSSHLRFYCEFGTSESDGDLDPESQTR